VSTYYNELKYGDKEILSGGHQCWMKQEILLLMYPAYRIREHHRVEAGHCAFKYKLLDRNFLPDFSENMNKGERQHEDTSCVSKVY